MGKDSSWNCASEIPQTGKFLDGCMTNEMRLLQRGTSGDWFKL